MNLNKMYPKYNKYINKIAIDLNNIDKNTLFVCIKGDNFNTHNHIQEIEEKGAVAIVVEEDIISNILTIKVDNTRLELARLCSIFFNYPSNKINLVGITGTDGKTTTATLISRMLDNSGYIGTNGIYYDNTALTSKNTTPNSLEINSILNDMVNSSIKNVATEVSSHAIKMYRTAYLKFDACIFTNLTFEHLDYHHTMEEYYLSKSSLFKSPNNHLSIINIDCKYGLRLYNELGENKISYGIDGNADYKAINISLEPNITFDLIHGKKIYKKISSPLTCHFNVYNILAAIAYLMEKGISIKEIRKKLLEIKKIDGRMNFIYERGPKVIVDFAHTPNALYNAITSVKQMTKGNLILVLGAAGNRDREKRPLMGEIATSFADFVIFTEEDNHFEDYTQIIDDLTNKLLKKNYIIVKNRKNAIKYAVKIANDNDLILICGKGNEKTMSVGNVVLNYNDIDEVRKYLN